MPEYTYTLRVMLPDEAQAIAHLANLVRYHGFPAVGELWGPIGSDGTRHLILRTDVRRLDRAQREERAIEALGRLDISSLGGEGTLRRVAQAVLDA